MSVSPDANKIYWIKLVLRIIRGFFFASGGIFIASAFGLCIMAMYVFHLRMEEHDACVKTVAEVVSVEKERAADEYLYVPVVRFSATDGNAYTLPLPGVVETDAYKVGASVRMAYPPDYPHAAREDTFTSFYMLPAIMSSMATVPFCMGLIMLAIGFVARLPLPGKNELAPSK